MSVLPGRYIGELENTPRDFTKVVLVFSLQKKSSWTSRSKAFGGQPNFESRIEQPAYTDSYLGMNLDRSDRCPLETLTITAGRYTNSY